jgi:hypothetical protein
VLCLLAGACGDEDAFPTSATTTSAGVTTTTGADPARVEDYISRPCEGIAPGDCAGPPPEVLGCLEP